MSTMDTTIERVACYVENLRYEDLSPATLLACTKRVIDAIGCALGAYYAEPVAIARTLALRAQASAGASVIGQGGRVLPELAAFANGVAVRYLDGNDTYPGGGGHPSDVVAPVLAIAQLVRADGQATVTAIVAAYEVYRAFFAGACMRDRGLDHVFYTAVASAMGAGKLLDLNTARLGHALSLAIVPNIALHATRRGHLSNWKGCAAPNGARNGVFAALLAQQGLTGPEQAVEGSHGLRELVGGFELGPLAVTGTRFAVENSNLKLFLSEYHSQSPIAHAIELSRETDVRHIEAIVVHTYWFAWSEIGSEAEKWHPTTRESADHSLPYILAAVMHKRSFGDDIFGADYLRNDSIHRLVDKVSILEDPGFTRDFPKKLRCRVEVRLDDGRVLTRESEHPKGHVHNPMTTSQVNEKFMTLAERVLTTAQARAALGVLGDLEGLHSVDMVFEALRVS